MTRAPQSFPSLEAFRQSQTVSLTGPVAILLAEDEVEVASTFTHLAARGFATIVVMGDAALALPEVPGPNVLHVAWQNDRAGASADAVNAVIAQGPGLWMHYCYNAEYLFFPFCETRRVGEMLAFHAEERRRAMLTFTIDLYTPETDPAGAVSLADAHLDASGYYATARRDPVPPHHPLDRQLDFFGGLRWRFEEHVPPDRRRIDRIAIFRAAPDVALRPDHTFTEPEYNTYACPWHNNLTAAICSFRAAKALTTNAGSRYDIGSFLWMKSVRFEWSSEQLMNLGLMEPGQWF